MDHVRQSSQLQTRALMILLTFLCYLVRHSLASPTSSFHHTRTSGNDNAAGSTTNPDLFTSGDRSIWNIIWSCSATIFACTWIAVHPNIPAKADSATRVLARRLAIMGYLLLAPEMVILWTARQYMGASEIADRHREKGWSRVHAFFLIMGGFSLYEKGVLLRTLHVCELEELVEQGKVDWPSITEEEIRDKSKGDFFSKSIVILQTGWFISQCIARGVNKLVVTELEVVTLAFSALTMIIYFFWWDKPLDVRVSFAVHVKESDGCALNKPEETDGQSPLPSADAVSTLSQAKRQPTEITGSPKHVSAETASIKNAEEEEKLLETSLTNLDQEGLKILNSSETKATSSSLPTTKSQSVLVTAEQPLQRLRAFIEKKQQRHGRFLGIGFVFFIYPFVLFFSPLADMASCTTPEGKLFRVPTFYSPEIEDESYCYLISLFVALVFGGIHCIAWSFHFLSLAEQWIWRISALLVSGLPVAIVFFAVILSSIPEEDSGTQEQISDAVTLLLGSMSFLYIVARVCLIVLPLITLRALTPGAYVDLDWTVFLPHI